MASVIAVCKSDIKGVRKEAVPEGVFKENFGMVGDAHASSEWHRQVSLLAEESINKMRASGLKLVPGDFGENLTTKDIDLLAIPVGTKLRVGQDVILEMSQHGKECHTACAIRKQVGKCIMPLEGVFARVIKGGRIKPGDKIEIGEKL
ncbi:MAG: MOSC domain-containing protein [Dehalococcoidales bacterium]|nr:MOSC domain-containing protein [Dehalococcoidales bacterium]